MTSLIQNLIARIFFVLLASSIFSCNKDGCNLTSGSLANESRKVFPFNEIILFDKINLILKEDPVQTITIEANKNLLAGIKTDVSNAVLTIKNGNACTLLASPGQQVNVYISIPQLQQITDYGAGDVNSVNTFHASEFTVDSWYGTGTVKLDIITNQLNTYIRNNNAQIILSGQSISTNIYCAAEGYINLFQLTSVNLYLNQRSVRDMDINVTGSLNADIVYKGNVFYKGNPAKIDSLITSSGRLIQVQ